MSSFLIALETSAFLYIAWLCGAGVFSLFAYKPRGVDVIVHPMIFGLGMIATVALVAALVGIFNVWFIFGSTLVIIFFTRNTIQEQVRKFYGHLRTGRTFARLRSFFATDTLLRSVLAIWILAYGVIAFMPWSFSNDGLAYHLPFALEMVETGTISFPLLNSQAYGHLPLLVEVIYGSLLLAFQNIIVFQTVQFALGITVLLLLGDFCYRHLINKRLIYFFAAVSLSVMPFISTVLGGGMIEVFTLVFGLAGTITLIDRILNEQEPKGRGSLFLAGSFLGMALATKYLALLFIPINGLLLLCLFFRRSNAISFRKIIRYAFGAFIFGGFWYVKNLVLTGDPFYPMFSPNDLGGAVEHFVLERNLLNYFLLPFAFWGLSSILHLPYALLNALQFLAAYVLAFILLVTRRITRREGIIIFFISLYLIQLFFWSHTVRFALAVLLLIVVLLAFLIDRVILLINSDRFKKIFASHLFRIGLTMSGLILCAVSLFSFKDKYECLLPKNTQACIAGRGTGVYYAIDHINRELREERIIEYWDTFFTYSLRNGNRFDDRFCVKELSVDPRPETVDACLRNSESRYFLDETGSRQSQMKYPHTAGAAQKNLVAEHIIANSSLIFEYYDTRYDSYIRLYELPRL